LKLDTYGNIVPYTGIGKLISVIAIIKLVV